MLSGLAGLYTTGHDIFNLIQNSSSLPYTVRPVISTRRLAPGPPASTSLTVNYQQPINAQYALPVRQPTVLLVDQRGFDPARAVAVRNITHLTNNSHSSSDS